MTTPERIADGFRRFAALETPGRSPLYGPPLALVEVGASAGLCLYPDRYSYDYDGHHVTPRHDAGVPRFRCAAGVGTPLPAGPVEVVRRAGLDLCRDGRPLARADPHASWIRWL